MTAEPLLPLTDSCTRSGETGKGISGATISPATAGKSWLALRKTSNGVALSLGMGPTQSMRYVATTRTIFGPTPFLATRGLTWTRRRGIWTPEARSFIPQGPSMSFEGRTRQIFGNIPWPPVPGSLYPMPLAAWNAGEAQSPGMAGSSSTR